MKKINLLNCQSFIQPYCLNDLNNTSDNLFHTENVNEIESRLNFIYNIRTKVAYNNFLNNFDINYQNHIFESAIFYQKYSLELYPLDIQILFALNSIKSIKSDLQKEIILTYDSIYKMYLVWIDYCENESDDNNYVISSKCVFINSSKKVAESFSEFINKIFIYQKNIGSGILEIYNRKIKEFVLDEKCSRKKMIFTAYNIVDVLQKKIGWNDSYYNPEKYFISTIDPSYSYKYIKHVEKETIKHDPLTNSSILNVDLSTINPSITTEIDIEDAILEEEPEDDIDRLFSNIAKESVIKTKQEKEKRIEEAFSQVIGLEDAKQTVKEKMIWAVDYPGLYKKYDKSFGGGILLYGPPGNGKTLFARMLSQAIDAKLIVSTAAEIESRFAGDTEKNIRDLFDEARKYKRAIIFLDEFDSLGGKRPDKGNENYSISRYVVPEMLNQMDGFKKYTNNIIVITATNRPWDIDSALLRSGRFDTKIHVRLPNDSERKKMFELKLKNIPNLSNDIDYQLLSELTNNYNGADIQEIVEKIRMTCITKEINREKNFIVNTSVIVEIINKFNPSVFKEDLEKLDEFERQYGLKSSRILSKEEKN